MFFPFCFQAFFINVSFLVITVTLCPITHLLYDRPVYLWVVLMLLLIPQRICTSCCFSATSLLINNSVTPNIAGSVNGIAMTSTALARVDEQLKQIFPSFCPFVLSFLSFLSFLLFVFLFPSFCPFFLSFFCPFFLSFFCPFFLSFFCPSFFPSFCPFFLSFFLSLLSFLLFVPSFFFFFALHFLFFLLYFFYFYFFLPVFLLFNYNSHILYFFLSPLHRAFAPTFGGSLFAWSISADAASIGSPFDVNLAFFVFGLVFWFCAVLGVTIPNRLNKQKKRTIS
ncbi:unnamed protein product [Acanthosepion pharaonis]|uniref:Uncharacterized protein n=1 Tax=Acanthosepion pharaonis TaxID=158019 RepID=A0A812B164_ACAPH|nr:unnamed protein product [Sepia pharaonis]